MLTDMTTVLNVDSPGLRILSYRVVNLVVLDRVDFWVSKKST